jgi:hypothetical protein
LAGITGDIVIGVIDIEYLDGEDIIEDVRFIEVTDKYDCSAWLYSYLVDNDISDDATIQYCFDH